MKINIKKIISSYTIALASILIAIIVAACSSDSGGGSSNNSGGIGKPFVNLDNAQFLSAGGAHSLIIKKNGTVWAFGINGNGQLGLGTTADINAAQQVIDISDATAVAAGVYHTLVIKKNGTLWAFGGNHTGQLGLGNNIDSSTAQQVSFTGDASNNVQAVAAGGSATIGNNGFTLVLKNNGSVWAFGSDASGQLGLGNNNSISTAQQIATFANDASAVAAGTAHSLVLKKDGSLWAFGWNNSGQLGLGNKTATNTPMPVLNLSQGVQAIAAGSNYSLVLKTDGSIWAFGNNSYGQLGLGNSIDSTSTAMAVTALNHDNKAIAAGGSHTLVLKNDGSLLAFGYNAQGRLGIGNQNSPIYTPTIVTNLDADVSVISAGLSHSIALKKDGTLWSFGGNAYGQLGLGNNVTTDTPALVKQYQ